MHNISLYFLGTAKPAHFQAHTFAGLVAKVDRATAACAPAYREFIGRAIDQARASARKGYAGFSVEHGTIGLSWKPCAVDAFALRLDRVCQSFPEFSGLDYLAAESLQEA